jgi:hypothetical protein
VQAQTLPPSVEIADVGLLVFGGLSLLADSFKLTK